MAQEDARRAEGTESDRLTSGRLLARNSVLNLLSQGAPMLVAVLAIPVLIGGLGTERFGVLTLAWMAIGYFSLFDLGLGRALTQLVAERLGGDREAEIPELAWTALFLMLIVGIVVSMALAVAAPYAVTSLLQIPEPLQGETLHTVWLLAAALPFVISTAALRGIMEARQQFGLLSAIRLPMGVLTYAGPLLVLPFSRSLVAVVAMLVFGRLVAWLVHLYFCLRTVPALRERPVIRREAMGPLIRFGGWMTVSNVVSPMMVYMDRLFIGATLSMAAVAYYVTPYEVIVKLLLVPAALLGVLFPAFATSFARDPQRTAVLYGSGLKVVFAVVFPVALVVVALAYDGLALWLGPEFAEQGTRVLQWLAIGVFVNSMAHMPLGVLLGVGRPDITGKLHLLELPLYVAGLWWLLSRYGIEGAAIAWTARVVFDAAALFLLAAPLLPGGRRIALRVGGAMLAALAVLAVAALLDAPLQKAAYLILVLPGFAILAWLSLFGSEERAVLRGAA